LHRAELEQGLGLAARALREGALDHLQGLVALLEHVVDLASAQESGAAEGIRIRPRDELVVVLGGPGEIARLLVELGQRLPGVVLEAGLRDSLVEEERLRLRVLLVVEEEESRAEPGQA